MRVNPLVTEVHRSTEFASLAQGGLLWSTADGSAEIVAVRVKFRSSQTDAWGIFVPLQTSIGTDVFWILDPGTQEECGPGLLMISVVATAIRVSRELRSTWMFIAFAKICGT